MRGWFTVNIQRKHKFRLEYTELNTGWLKLSLLWDITGIWHVKPVIDNLQKKYNNKMTVNSNYLYFTHIFFYFSKHI